MRTLRGPPCPAACSPPVPWWAEAWPWSLWSVCSKRRWQETNDQSGDTRPQATWSHSKENGHQGHCRILKRWCECHMPQWPPNTRTCIQQRSYKNIHQVPGVKSRLFKDSICRVLWTLGWCSTRCSVITQRLLVQVQGVPGWGRRQTVHSLTRLPLSWVWLWSRVGDVLTLSQPLGYLYKVETARR